MDVTTALGLLAVAVLILLNGYFVAAEFAYVAVKRGRLEALAESGDRKATRAVRVLGRLSFMLSGAQLGITVTSLLVGFIAEPTLGAAITPLLTAAGLPESSAPGIALSIGFVLATAAQMIIGELAPKNLAIAKPEPMSRALASSTLLFLRIAGPLIRLFDSSANRLLRSLGIEPVEELEGGIHPDELELIVAESQVQGHLDEEHADALMRALEFGDLDAGAVAVPLRDVISVTPDSTMTELSRLIHQTGHSRFPVLDVSSGVALGIVGTRDLLEVPRSRWGTTSAAAQAHAVPAVPDTSALVGVLDVLRSAHSQSALVIDEHGTLTGLITFEDLMEELVGEIRDEHDPAEPDVLVAESADSWRVAGRARLDEVARETGIELPEGDYDTVAGLVVAELGRLAEVGDAVTVEPISGLDADDDVVRLEVLAVDGYVVGDLRMTTPSHHPDDPTATDADADAEAGR